MLVLQLHEIKVLKIKKVQMIQKQMTDIQKNLKNLKVDQRTHLIVMHHKNYQRLCSHQRKRRFSGKHQQDQGVGVQKGYLMKDKIKQVPMM